MRRINVIGTSCSGKTTLARALGERLGLPVTELDALFWDSGWTPVPTGVFRDRIAAATAGEAWVVDGSYAAQRSVTWARVELVVWLDYPLRIVLGRWARRTIRRIRSGEEHWPGTGNRETVRRAFGREALLWFILRTHRGRRHRNAAQLRERPDIAVVRLRSPAATERWLAGVQPGSSIPRATAGAIASAQKP